MASLPLAPASNQPDSIWLWQGISEGSGEINAALNIGTHKALQGTVDSESMLDPINQGSGKLVIVAGQDISAGNINAESLSAANDVVYGTELERDANTENRIFVQNDKIQGTFSPRGTITAKNISVGRNLFAEEIKATGGSPSSVSARNMVIVQEDQNPDLSLPPSTGNFTLDNGNFKFSGADLGLAGGVSVPWGARIDGEMKITGNGESSFTTMTVGEQASITGGSLSGQSLEAKNAAFTSLSAITLEPGQNLDATIHPYSLSTQENIAISGNQDAKIATARAGANINVTGGSYTGESAQARAPLLTGAAMSALP